MELPPPPRSSSSGSRRGIPGATAEVTGDGHHFNAVVSRRPSRACPGSPSTGSSTTCSARRSGTASTPCQSRPRLETEASHERRATNPLRDAIQSAIDENDVILFMKGTPDQPMCGFSARTVAILQSVGRPFAAVNILPDPRIRQELSARVQLADDPAAVHRRRVRRRAATSSPRCTSRASCTRRSGSRTRPPRRRPSLRRRGVRPAHDREPPLALSAPLRTGPSPAPSSPARGRGRRRRLPWPGKLGVEPVVDGQAARSPGAARPARRSA